LHTPTHHGTHQTDDLSLEYAYKALKFAAFKRPNQPVPRVACSVEHDFEVRACVLVWAMCCGRRARMLHGEAAAWHGMVWHAVLHRPMITAVAAHVRRVALHSSDAPAAVGW
jgi:hypothetical protein